MSRHPSGWHRQRTGSVTAVARYPPQMTFEFSGGETFQNVNKSVISGTFDHVSEIPVRVQAIQNTEDLHHLAIMN